MSNDELKKKIVKILEDGYTPIEHADGDCGQTYFPTNEDVADALIAEGLCFGNKHRIFIENAPISTTCVENTFYIVPNTPPTIKQLYGDEEVEQIVKERDEYKYRAEVAERALDKATEIAYTYRTQDDTLSCSSCPFDSIFDRCKERGLYEDCSKRWKEELLRQAEKELMEVEK